MFFFRRDGVSIFSLVDWRRIVNTRGFTGCYESYCRFFVLFNIPVRNMAYPWWVYIWLIIAIFILPSDNVTYMLQSVMK